MLPGIDEPSAWQIITGGDTMRCPIVSAKIDLERSIMYVEEQYQKIKACVDNGCEDLMGAMLHKECILKDLRAEWQQKYFNRPGVNHGI